MRVLPAGATLLVHVALHVHRHQAFEVGFGEALLKWVIASGRRVELSVGRWNRAQRLYLRLGFAIVAEDDVYLHLVRQPLS